MADEYRGIENGVPWSVATSKTDSVAQSREMYQGPDQFSRVSPEEAKIAADYRSFDKNMSYGESYDRAAKDKLKLELMNELTLSLDREWDSQGYGHGF